MLSYTTCMCSGRSGAGFRRAHGMCACTRRAGVSRCMAASEFLLLPLLPAR